MDIIIVRHATAEEQGRKRDEDRKLTRGGKQEAAITGQAMKAMGVKPEKVLTSPLIRARETADIVGAELGVEVEELELLAPPGDPKEALTELEEMNRQGLKCVVLVGHNPSLEQFIGYFVSANTEARVSLCKSGAAGLSYDPQQQAQPTLEWLLRKKQLKLLSEMK